jgi:tetratricopeptide (TPR) repeat protein
MPDQKTFTKSVPAKKRKNISFDVRHSITKMLPIIIVLAVFARASRYEFVNYDDGINIYDNPYIKQFNLLHFWKGPYLGLYIPLAYNLWAFQAQLARTHPAESAECKLNPQVFHVTNIIFHVLSVLIVFAILNMLIKDDWTACAGALLFGLHPVQVEPVAWITGYKNVLGGFLALLAIWQYLSYARLHSSAEPSKGGTTTSPKREALTGKRGRLRYLAATIFFGLAILAMPMAIIVPLITGIISYFIMRRSLRRYVVEMIPWVVLALPIMILTKLSQPDIGVEFVVPFWQRPFIAGHAIVFYLSKLFWPVLLGPDYGQSPKLVLENGLIYIKGLIPYFAAIILLWKFRTSWLLTSFGIFIAGIIPVLGFVPFVFQDISTVADRYLYLAMLGPALALAKLLSAHRNAFLWTFCVLILGLLGLGSAHQTQYWRDSRTLFQHALRVNSGSWMAHNNLGLALEKQGEFEKALVHYNEAIKLKPTFAEPNNNMGIVFQKQGKFGDAFSAYVRATLLDPVFPEAYNNLGAVLEKLGRLEEAAQNYAKAINLDPVYADPHFNPGNTFSRLGRLQEAIDEYRKALEINPRFFGAHNNIAIALQRQGKYEEAIAHLREALNLEPKHAGTRNNLGILFYQTGKIKEAIVQYSKAIETDPGFAEAHYNLGIALEKDGMLDEAIAHYQEALRIKPDLKQALVNLERALREKNKLSMSCLNLRNKSSLAFPVD